MNEEGRIVKAKDLTRYEQMDGGEEGVVGLTKTKDVCKSLMKNQ